MVVKVYVSGISGNKEVKKRQQRVMMILDSKNIQYDVIDITEPGKESDKDFMQNNSKSNGGTVSDPNPRSPLPPQLFNDEEYCGDYDQFDLANEVDTLEQFLKVEVPAEEPAPEDNVKTHNGEVGNKSKENSQERENTESEAEIPAEETNDKEKSALREATPAERTASKEGSPEKNDEEVKEEEKESSPVREKSVEKEESKEVESTNLSKENSPEKEAVNENGTESSRNPSEEKETESAAIESKKDPSELLIESEQTASAE